MARPDLPSPPARLAAVLAAPSGSPGHRGGGRGPGGTAAPEAVLVDGPSGDAGRQAAPVEPHPSSGGRVAGALRRLLPVAWQGARIDPGRPGATALALVAAAAAVVAAVGVWIERPRSEPVGVPPGLAVVTDQPAAGPTAESTGVATQPVEPVVTAPAPDAAAGPVPEPATEMGGPQLPVPLVVSVSGRVHRPGLVEVPPGARVADVLHAAGGALPGTDLAGLNLARRVADGEQVAVGVPPAPDAVPANGSGGSAPAVRAAPGAPPGRVDLNAATVEQLDALPGVGPVTAQRILEWRTRHGRFSRVEQLREIEGIGERRFGQLRELVRV